MKNIVNVSQYPYGKVYRKLKNAAKWINKNQNILKSKLQNNENFDMFDYPDYWNMPKKISYILSSDEVDFIQDQTYGFYKKYARYGY